MSSNRRNDPFHMRIFEPRTNGGPSVKHLRMLASKLTTEASAVFNMAISPPPNGTDQRTLAAWISGNFSHDQINTAHRELCEFYTRQSRYSRAPINTKTEKGETPIEPNYAELEKRIMQLPDQQNNKQKNKDNKPDSSDNQEYVLRKDYDADLKHQAEVYLGLEKKVDGISTRIIGDVVVKLTELDEKINNIKIKAPTIVELRKPDAAPVKLGTVHYNFPTLLQFANARFRNGCRHNIWLYGPPGTGKTHAAEQLADIYFGADYQSQPEVQARLAQFKAKYNQDWSNYNYNGSLATSFQVVGYQDAAGRYVPTPFRFAWEFGGVYLFDEIDGSMPDALLALNGALANSIASFPDGMIRRHPDCVILAGANTTGLGGGVEYVGAMKQNAAFLDRWDKLDWNHDDALEDALCANKDWLARVRKVRANQQRAQIKGHMITMRASLKGESLLAAGVSQQVVENSVLRSGLSDAQWNNIK